MAIGSTSSILTTLSQLTGVDIGAVKGTSPVSQGKPQGQQTQAAATGSQEPPKASGARGSRGTLVNVVV